MFRQAIASSILFVQVTVALLGHAGLHALLGDFHLGTHDHASHSLVDAKAPSCDHWHSHRSYATAHHTHHDGHHHGQHSHNNRHSRHEHESPQQHHHHHDSSDCLICQYIDQAQTSLAQPVTAGPVAIDGPVNCDVECRVAHGLASAYDSRGPPLV